MAKNKGDDLLREQRKRQQELIELKKRQQGIDDGTATATVEPEPVKYSKWKTFWYYSWKQIVAIVIVAAVFAVCIAQCSNKKDDDLTVVVYCDAFIHTDSILLMQNEFAKYCEDYNGDGEVNIRIANCAATGNDVYSEEGTAKATQLMAQFSNEEAILYIVDEKCYEKLLNVVENGFIDTSLGLPDKDGAAYCLNDTGFMNTLNIESAITGNKLDYSEKTFYAFCRATDNGTIIAENDNVDEFAKRAHEVLNKMMEAYVTEN